MVTGAMVTVSDLDISEGGNHMSPEVLGGTVVVCA